MVMIRPLFEVKHSLNQQYLHGYEVQVQEYGKAEQIEKLIYVLSDTGHAEKSEADFGNI